MLTVHRRWLELVEGVKPTTVRLQDECTIIVLYQHIAFIQAATLVFFHLPLNMVASPHYRDRKCKTIPSSFTMKTRSRILIPSRPNPTALFPSRSRCRPLARHAGKSASALTRIYPACGRRPYGSRCFLIYSEL